MSEEQKEQRRRQETQEALWRFLAQRDAMRAALRNRSFGSSLFRRF